MVPPPVQDAFLEGKIDAKEFNRIVGGPCLVEPDDMVGVREYGGEGFPVKLVMHSNGRWVLESLYQAGFDGTLIDLLDVVAWVKANKPELLQ
jgi:hypothetical protein